MHSNAYYVYDLCYLRVIMYINKLSNFQTFKLSNVYFKLLDGKNFKCNH